MRERHIERYLVDRVKSFGGIAYKFTSPQRVNVPDRIVVMPGGTLIFVELKSPGCKPNPAQRREHERLRELGQRVEVIDSLAGVDALLEGFGA